MTRQKKYLSAVLVAVVLAFFLPARSYAQLPSWEVPLFQYTVFYNLNLEVDPSATFQIEGPVFCNAGIWAGTPNTTYASTVEAVGQVNTTGTDPFVSGKSDSGTPKTIFLYPGQPVSGVAPITTQNGEPALTNAEVLINLPPSNLRAPQQTAYFQTNQTYDFNAASLIVSNWYWGSNGLAPWSNNFTVYLQDSAFDPSAVLSNGVAMHWTMLTNDYYIVSNRYHSFAGLLPYSTNYVPNFRFTNNFSSIRWTNTVVANGPLGTNCVWHAGFSFLTNVSFRDYRESAIVQAVQLDVGKLGIWITNATRNGGSGWNQDLSSDLGNGIDSIFIYNAVPFTDQQQLPAVRVINGWLLPASGLTVVTPQPMYVFGSYNVQASGEEPFLGWHNTTYTYPAALMADAITLLSSNWNDAYNVNTSLSSRSPAPITINAACLSGIVPSSGANYSGGVENYFRLLENWNGATSLTFNGSIAAMFSSIYATQPWQVAGVYYNAPLRNWAFDTNFMLLSKLPPLTWLVINSNSAPIITTEPINETVSLKQNTNFTVIATGVPAVGYQWNFEGTNIPGATNESLVLTNLQLKDAGNYSVEVTNVLGSVISSNALLSVSAQVLNSFSFSPIAGAGFTVSGMPGFSYVVMASSNLVDWVPLRTNRPPFIFTDTNTALPQRFYRSIYVP